MFFVFRARGTLRARLPLSVLNLFLFASFLYFYWVKDFLRHLGVWFVFAQSQASHPTHTHTDSFFLLPSFIILPPLRATLLHIPASLRSSCLHCFDAGSNIYIQSFIHSLARLSHQTLSPDLVTRLIRLRLKLLLRRFDSQTHRNGHLTAERPCSSLTGQQRLG